MVGRFYLARAGKDHKRQVIGKGELLKFYNFHKSTFQSLQILYNMVEFIQRLFMVKMPHWPTPYGKVDINLGLERVLELLQRLGNPQLLLPNIIHVAGTNGKGSTLAFLRAILEKGGYDCNVYTSPHIYRFNERIVLLGAEISDEKLYEMAEVVREATGDLQTTFFEATTVIALLAMSQVKSSKPIMNLIEVGLGGRLDATNVIENPLCSVITPIDFDHMEFLGDTLAKIATEKAGILKHGSHGVVSWQYSEAMQAIAEVAAAQDVPLFASGQSFDFEVLPDGNFLYHDAKGDLMLPAPSLFGPHQYLNAATAVATIKTLPQLNIQDTHIKEGLSTARWPARMERVRQGKIAAMLPPNFELWVDGAHNVGGARVAALAFHNMPKMHNIIINGRTLNRDIGGFLQCFVGLADQVYAVPVISEPKCEKAATIADIAVSLGFQTEIADSVWDAIAEIIKKEAQNARGVRIIVIGSLYLAADILVANKNS